MYGTSPSIPQSRTRTIPGCSRTGGRLRLPKKSLPEHGLRLRLQNLHRGLTVKEAMPGLKDAGLRALADPTTEQKVTYDCALLHRCPRGRAVQA